MDQLALAIVNSKDDSRSDSSSKEERKNGESGDEVIISECNNPAEVCIVYMREKIA